MRKEFRTGALDSTKVRNGGPLRLKVLSEVRFWVLQPVKEVMMSAISQVDSDFAFVGAAEAAAAAAATGDPLGPLAELPGPGDTPGTWVGHGFNAIWRPHRLPGHDRFLELNLTDDKIVFTRIDGDIPNRGLDMPDINMHGVTYMQQINEAGNPAAGLHIEPGIWAVVPQTSNPAEPPTVVRMASIPHGTVINAQGVFQVIPGGPQNIPDNNILPFFFGQPVPTTTPSSTRWR